MEADMPFEQDWWKYAYWVPKVKKDFYMMAITSPDFNRGLIDMVDKYKMDFWFFSKHYKHFIKRLEWMRRNEANHIGEVKNGK